MGPGEQENAQQLARVLRTFGVSEPAIEFGDSQAGIAEITPARGQAARTVSAAQIEASGGMPVERIGELMQAFGFPPPAPEELAFTPDEAHVADTLLVGVHRRWIEYEASQIAVLGAERDAGEQALPGAVLVSILFCDLKDFTAFGDREGDVAAVRIIDQFALVVTREHGPNVRLTKWLGDGFMLVYPGPGLAVAAGLRIIDGMRAADGPGVHASVHHGYAIPREGEYFGSMVNLTARLLSAARRDELVATRPVVERCPDVTWRPDGTHRVRGIEAPVEVFKLRG